MSEPFPPDDDEQGAIDEHAQEPSGPADAERVRESVVTGPSDAAEAVAGDAESVEDGAEREDAAEPGDGVEDEADTEEQVADELEPGDEVVDEAEREEEVADEAEPAGDDDGVASDPERMRGEGAEPEAEPDDPKGPAATDAGDALEGDDTEPREPVAEGEEEDEGPLPGGDHAGGPGLERAGLQAPPDGARLKSILESLIFVAEKPLTE
ncbi:MAG: hypothetical protein R3B40_30740, partial [Polyangiales bacterium]